MKCQLVPSAEVDWDFLDRFDDRVFSQRRHWLAFAEDVSGGQAAVGRLEDDGEVVGFVSGIRFHRLGIPIFGSPFPGWTSPYMGFNLVPGVSRRDALKAFESFVFNELGCLHLELVDRYLTLDDVEGLGYEHRIEQSFLSSLSWTEDDIFASFHGSRRRAIRKANKSGVVVEQADPEGFAEEYFAQLEEVFGKQGLKPTYGPDRVQKLIDRVGKSGDLLLVRARDADGESIATGIFPGYGQFSHFFGNGSLRNRQTLRPNEAIHWFAMRYWKDRGMAFYDWGGGGDYKAKYGGEVFTVPRLTKSRYHAVAWARNAAYRLYYFPRKLKRSQFLRTLGR